jgi:hypothetical protein
VKHGRRDVDRVARTHLERLAVVEHLLTFAREDVKDLFRFGMVVPVVALSRLEHDLTERHPRALRALG